LTGWELSRLNFTGASLRGSTLTNAVLSGTVVIGADFEGTTSRGFTEAQLASTASYQAKNLRGIGLSYNNLRSWDFSGQNLSNASLGSSTLTNANLSGVTVTGARFGDTTSRGFTQAQLASTASYQAKNLQGIGLGNNELTGWDLSGQNLTGADFYGSTLTDADLSGAVVRGADFGGATGLTQAQLASTTSYQAKDLTGIGLEGNDLSGWDLSGQNLTNARLSRLFGFTSLTQANLSGANLNNGNLSFSSLSQANLSGANLKNTNLLGASDLASAVFSSRTMYNQWTAFPDGFDPTAFGLTLMLSPLGDMAANDVLDVADIEMLQQRLLGRLLQYWLPDAMFDVNSDDNVTSADVTVWVKDLKHTWFGDANLDGEFSGGDLVQVFAAGKYEATERNFYGDIVNPATWSTGDWNTDGEFTSSDLVLAFQDGGYEAGPRTDVAAVPEPSGLIPLALGLGGLIRIRPVRQPRACPSPLQQLHRHSRLFPMRPWSHGFAMRERSSSGKRTCPSSEPTIREPMEPTGPICPVGTERRLTRSTDRSRPEPAAAAPQPPCRLVLPPWERQEKPVGRSRIRLRHRGW
jgi:uncharacterized protein YjbI with pentapeptide repeats